MIILTNVGTSDTLQVTCGTGVTSVEVHASWVDDNAGAMTPGNTNTTITSSTAATSILPSVTSGHQLNVKAMTIRNVSATATLITITHTINGGTGVVMLTYTLQPNETIQYFDTTGFQVMDASGALKLSPGVGRFMKRTVYTSGTNTFTPQAGSNTLIVTVVGGGGGGGASGTGNAGNDNAGGGGGSGATTIRKYAVSAAATYTATVGGGGNGGVAASNNGSTGTLSSFTDGTTQINGAGGLGGVFGPAIAAAPLVAPGGAGGAANANGDINTAGEPGQAGMRLAAAVAVSGGGAASAYGGGGVGALNGRATGAAGTNYGSGGAGGENNAAGGAAGGAGSGGLIIVDEYT